MHPQIHPSAARPPMLPEQVELRVMDICDGIAWSELLRDVRPRAIIHLAAETGTGQSLDLPTRHTHTNVTGTATMLEALDGAGCAPQQMLIASSRAVYGEGVWSHPETEELLYPDQRSPDQLTRGEFEVRTQAGDVAVPQAQSHRSTPARPVSIYGATKLAQEHILASWCVARNIPLTVLRLQNVYGDGQSPYNSYTGIIGLFHRTAAAGKAIEVYEDGEIGRDFVHVEDVARAMGAALKNPPERCRAIDVGTGVATTILGAATLIADMYAAPAPRITGAFRSGDIRWAVCSPEALKNELMITPQIDFAEGNRRLSLWLRATKIIA